jgi:hypothetical protein
MARSLCSLTRIGLEQLVPVRHRVVQIPNPLPRSIGGPGLLQPAEHLQLPHREGEQPRVVFLAGLFEPTPELLIVSEALVLLTQDGTERCRQVIGFVVRVGSMRRKSDGVTVLHLNSFRVPASTRRCSAIASASGETSWSASNNLSAISADVGLNDLPLPARAISDPTLWMPADRAERVAKRYEDPEGIDQ